MARYAGPFPAPLEDLELWECFWPPGYLLTDPVKAQGCSTNTVVTC